MMDHGLSSQDVRELMTWFGEEANASSLHLRIGSGLTLDVRKAPSTLTAGGIAEEVSDVPSTQVRSPYAGKFTQSCSVGTAVRPDTVIGTIKLSRTSHEVLAGADGRLESYLVGDLAAVEYGEVIAVVSPIQDAA